MVKVTPKQLHDEAATLRQTQKIRYFPIVLADTSYWSGLVDWLRSTVLEAGNVVAADVESLVLCDSADEVLACVEAVEHRRPPHHAVSGVFSRQ